MKSCSLDGRRGLGRECPPHGRGQHLLRLERQPEPLDKTNSPQGKERNGVAELGGNPLRQHRDGTLLILVEISPGNAVHRVPRILQSPRDDDSNEEFKNLLKVSEGVEIPRASPVRSSRRDTSSRSAPDPPPPGLP